MDSRVGGSVHNSMAGLNYVYGQQYNHLVSAGSKNSERLLQSRQAATPHHHARVAAAAARTANNLSLSRDLDDSIDNVSLKETKENREKDGKDKRDKDGKESKEKAKSSDWVTIDMGGMLLRNLAPSVFDFHFLTTLYLNHNNFTYIPHQIANLKCLTLLDLSGNKLVSIPPELGSVVSLKELLLFDNQLTFLPIELGALYQLEVFGIEGNPLTEPYMGYMQKDGALAIISYMRENLPSGPPPAEREWITLDESFSQNDPNSFTILCYNTLCDKYATPQTYSYTPSWALAWDYRKELILSEIVNYNADIVCLQEMETGQFEEYFQEYFISNNLYEGVFWPKSRSRTMGEYERRAVDGCATFFRPDKFTLVEKHSIEFQQIAMQRPELRRTEDVFNRVMVKDNIGLITVLESKDANPKFKVVVANTHLHWDPSDPDVKLVQTAMLMEEVTKIVAAHAPSAQTGPPGSAPRANGNGSSVPPVQQVPVIVCGDFNSLPGSGVHSLLGDGSVPAGHEDFGKYTYGAYTREGISHQLNLKSVYPPSVTGELNGKSEASTTISSSATASASLDFTNYTPMFKGVIDYIWVSGMTLSVGGVLGGVDKEHVKGCVGFPNVHHASDHVPIMAALSYKGVPGVGGKDKIEGGRRK
ncbi:Glucose-repressible alcohol dehydrogenase transcriptional effector [Chytriomyces hyalinus]|nr:Glucose-repressible alcohol dehydrogenase transcriptional effector [Chytriomyces hyalinus]